MPVWLLNVNQRTSGPVPMFVEDPLADPTVLYGVLCQKTHKFFRCPRPTTRDYSTAQRGYSLIQISHQAIQYVGNSKMLNRISQKCAVHVRNLSRQN